MLSGHQSSEGVINLPYFSLELNYIWLNNNICCSAFFYEAVGLLCEFQSVTPQSWWTLTWDANLCPRALLAYAIMWHISYAIAFLKSHIIASNSQHLTTYR